MAVHLIVARAGAQAALAGDTSVVEDPTVLLDRTEDVPHASFAVRIGERLAIGRREGDRAAWWVVTPDFPLQPPHALWTVPGLFRPDGEGNVPREVDIAALWETITAGSDPGEWVTRIVRVVRYLRATDGPVALVVDAPHAALEAAGALLAVLMGPSLTIAVGHPAPDPRFHRLSIGPDVPAYPEADDVFVAEGDRVADFVRSRLRTEPQCLVVEGGLTEEAIERILDDEGLSDEQTSSSVGVLDALEQGAPLDDALVDAIVAATLPASDPALWEALAVRPEFERRKAALALIRRAGEVQPTRAFVDAFMEMVPRGMPLAPLASTLLDWMRRADRPAILAGHLETALTIWPQEAGPANRASLWTEAVRILVQTGHPRDAAEAVAGPVATRMIEEGSGTAVALMWTGLPTEHRNPLRLAQITEALARHPTGDQAAANLLVTLEGDQALAFCRTWVKHRGKGALRTNDAVLHAAVEGPLFATWLAAVREQRGTRTIRDALAPLLSEPTDPRWVEVHQALSAGEDPVTALRLAGDLPAAAALEPVARDLLLPALGELRFPDAHLAQTAARFAQLDGSPLWGWVGVASAPPGAHPDEVIDGTIVELCEHPPSPTHRMTCRAVGRQLGAAASWTSLDHARWLVRLALAPQESGLAEELLEAMLEGLVGRFDAAPHMAGLVGEMMQLGPRHPALVGLLRRWLPQAWRARMPAAFVEAVRVRGVPPDVQPLWDGLVDADR
jgi:hypothetical protein